MIETLAPSRHSKAAPQPDAAPGFEVHDPEFGPGGQVLFITTDTAVWAAVLATAGAGQGRS
jgi:hypothetical protein